MTCPIEKRIRIRKETEATFNMVLDIIGEELNGDNSENIDRSIFWELMIDMILEHDSGLFDRFRVDVKEVLTDAQAKAFENTTVDFGKHKGKRVRDVPLDYLLWLDDQVDFRRRLRAYLKNPKVQREIK